MKFLPIILIALAALLGSTLWALFAQGQKNSAKEIFSFETERLADQIFRTQLEGELKTSGLPEEVLGFGVYSPARDLVHGWGDVPPQVPEIKPEEQKNRYPSFVPVSVSGKAYTFVKVLQPLGPRPRPPEMGPLMPPADNRPGRAMGPPGIEGFLLLKVNDEQIADRMLTWDILTFAVPFLGIFLLMAMARLWSRNKQYQLTIQRNQELLQYAEAAKTLSHEIKNPLAAILLQTAILKRLPGVSAPEVKIIEEETQRINQLVKRVGDFLRDPRGNPTDIDLQAVLTSLKDRFETPIPLTFDSQENWTVRFDASRFRSVLENLIRNACESGPDPQPEIVVSHTKGNWIRVEVLDRGTGLDQEALKKAFTPFYTRKTSGTGIGLSISRDFILAAGGRISLANRADGQGAVATIELPSVGGDVN